MGKDYSAQEKHIRKHYARFPLDLRPEVLEEFKKVCKENGLRRQPKLKNSLLRIAKRRGQSSAEGGRICRPFSFVGRRNKNAQALNVDRSP